MTAADPFRTLAMTNDICGISPVEGIDTDLNVGFLSLEFEDPGLDAGKLIIRSSLWVNNSLSESIVTVRFDEVCGFRVLSESDMLDFHDDYDFANGWLFRVHSGGWFDQESQRAGFLRQHVPFYIEYLFEDAETFISVLSKGDPSVEVT